MKADEIKKVRLGLGFSQVEFARALGVSFTTVNRWENGKAAPQNDRLERIQELAARKEAQTVMGYDIQDAVPTTLNFEGDPEAIKLVVDAHRLRNGQQFNKAFGLELSRVVALPHQRVAVMNTCSHKTRCGFCWPPKLFINTLGDAIGRGLLARASGSGPLVSLALDSNVELAVKSSALPPPPPTPPLGRRLSERVLLSAGEVQSLAEGVSTLTKSLAGCDVQFEVAVSIKTKPGVDLKTANDVLGKIKDGWKL